MTSVSTSRRQGLNSSAAIKVPVRVATTANIALNGLQTIDGVVLVAEDRVLVKDQTTTSENGIYTADTGNWSRALDFDGAYDVLEGTILTVIHGNTLAGSWRVSTPTPSIGSALAFVQSSLSPADANAVNFTQAGAGAVTRTVQDKERDIVSVFDFMTANEVLYTRTFGASGTIGDLKASLDLAFAQTGKMVCCPPGLYNVASNLAMPTCMGIFGDRWNPLSGNVGTLFQFQSPVSVGFDLGGSGFHYFGGINIYGGSTNNATGLRLGYCGGTQNLMNHALIEDVRIWSFPGTSVGMFMADMNYCDFRKIWINDCNTNIYASSTYTVGGGNSTVPTDINMYGITSLQSRDNNFVIKTLGANIYGLKLAHSVGAALVTGGLSDTGAKLNTDLKIYGMSLEFNNTSTAPGSPYWAINLSHDAANSGYGTITIYEAGHDSTADKFLKADGDRCNVVVHGPNIFGTAWTADHFRATASANIMIDGYPGVLTGFTHPDLQSICSEATSGKITGPEVRKAVTLVATGFNPDITLTGYYYKNGKQVTLYIPQFSGTSDAATFVISGIPAEITPSIASQHVVGVQDNTGTFAPGLLVNNAGSLTLYSTLAAATWTAAGTKTLLTSQITYLLP